MDVYLQPSLTEGLPRSLIEAMSRGCPALASLVGGIPELLSPGQMVKPGDYRELSIKLSELVVDRSKMKELASNNFKKARKYNKSVIDARRTQFWADFRSYVLSST